MAENQFEKRVSHLDAAFERLESTFEKRVVRLETRLAEAESRIIKWTFAFVFGQFWAMIGILFVFFKK